MNAAPSPPLKQAILRWLRRCFFSTGRSVCHGNLFDFLEAAGKDGAPDVE